MKSLPENKEFCQGDSDLICFFHNFLWAATKVAASTIAKPLWGFRAYQALTLAKPSLRDSQCLILPKTRTLPTGR